MSYCPWLGPAQATGSHGDPNTESGLAADGITNVVAGAVGRLLSTPWTSVRAAAALEDVQLANPRRAAVQNMGGVGIANYVSVLEAV